MVFSITDSSSSVTKSWWRVSPSMTLGTSRSVSGTFSGSSSGGSEGGWDRDVPSVKGAIFKGWPHQHERETSLVLA